MTPNRTASVRLWGLAGLLSVLLAVVGCPGITSTVPLTSQLQSNLSTPSTGTTDTTSTDEGDGADELEWWEEELDEGEANEDADGDEGDASADDDVEPGEDEPDEAAESAAPSITLLTRREYAPFVVRFDLRLFDSNGRAIGAGVTREMFTIEENGRVVDYRETNQFVTPGPNLPLKLMLVLDYTNSMHSAAAIDDMVVAARALVMTPHFTASHHIGVVEFHDRQEDDFSLAVPLTRAEATAKQAIADGIPEVIELEHGLTRVWDAVDLAIDTLDQSSHEAGEVWAIVFLTDGHDTTSTRRDAHGIRDEAQRRGIILYPIGFGAVDPQDEETMRSMAEQTGGLYSPAANAAALGDVFRQIIDDLKGQWNLTYITQKNQGTVNVNVTFTWGGAADSFAHSFGAGDLEGDIHQGILEVFEREYDDVADQTRFRIKARYVPRNISRFRFVFANSAATFALQATGGLTDPAAGWVPEALGDGVYELSCPTPLEMGAFGNIGVVTLPGDVPSLQVSHDDSVYADLSQPKTMVFEGELWAAPYVLNIAIDPEDGGTVTRTPDKPGYGHGEAVTLTATANATYGFANWSGDASGSDATVTVTMDGDRDITAEFRSLGDDCNTPLVVNVSAASLPFVDTNTTCGHGDDYWSTCLGSRDNSEDIIYQLDVAAAVNVSITLDPKGAVSTGIALFDACPTSGSCLAESNQWSSDPHGTGCIELAPGTYYVMVDREWGCISEFELTLAECAGGP